MGRGLRRVFSDCLAACSAYDILVTILLAATVTAAVVVLLRESLLAARLALLALTSGVFGLTLNNSVEFMARSGAEVSTVQAGEIVSLIGAAGLRPA